MWNKCTPLWREAHCQVKMYKAHQRWSTFGNWDVEKVHDIVSWSTCRSQNLQSTPASEHFWKLRCAKSARRCGAKHTFGRSDVVFAWQAQGIVHLVKSVGRCGTFEEDLQTCISRCRCSTRDMFIRDVRRSGRWFPERGCIWEHQIFRFAKMILCDTCSTLYDLALLFRGPRSTLGRWSGEIAKCIGTRPWALYSPFHFWRKSRRIVSFLTLSRWKIVDVLQACFVFDVVIFEHWGGLAE